MLHVLSYTSSLFAETVSSTLRRGKVQAKDWYKSFVRNQSTPASFNNAPLLLQEIEQLVDTTIDPIIHLTQDQDSGTEKFLIKMQDGLEVESVVIPMKQKKTLCVSCQIGCRMNCSFCSTGSMGFRRNLEAREIVEQLFVACFILHQPIHNIVFMGMGEPFDTMDEVMKAYEIFSDPDGFGIGRKNITLSTSGHVDGILKLAHYKGFAPNIAVSLHAADDELRSSLMPINHRFNLKQLKEALQIFCREQKREVLIVYLLLRGINDSPAHAHSLLRFLDGLPAKINLTSYNCKTEGSFQTSSDEVREKFYQILRAAGYRVLLRQSKGAAIQAACGQLVR